MPLEVFERVVVLRAAELAAVEVVFDFGLGGLHGLSSLSRLVGLSDREDGGAGRNRVGDGVGAIGLRNEGCGHEGVGGLREERDVLGVLVLVVRGELSRLLLLAGGVVVFAVVGIDLGDGRWWVGWVRSTVIRVGFRRVLLFGSDGRCGGSRGRGGGRRGGRGRGRGRGGLIVSMFRAFGSWGFRRRVIFRGVGGREDGAVIVLMTAKVGHALEGRVLTVRTGEALEPFLRWGRGGGGVVWCLCGSGSHGTGLTLDVDRDDRGSSGLGGRNRSTGRRLCTSGSMHVYIVGRVVRPVLDIHWRSPLSLILIAVVVVVIRVVEVVRVVVGVVEVVVRVGRVLRAVLWSCEECTGRCGRRFWGAFEVTYGAEKNT